jgi:hypothetical protein
MLYGLAMAEDASRNPAGWQKADRLGWPIGNQR